MTEGETITHPRYRGIYHAGGVLAPEDGLPVLIGDEVVLATDMAHPVGIVTAIYLDGLLELSTGDDDVMAADLVLLRRADQ